MNDETQTTEASKPPETAETELGAVGGLSAYKQQAWVHRITQARAARVDVRTALARSNDPSLSTALPKPVRYLWCVGDELDQRLAPRAFHLVERKAR